MSGDARSVCCVTPEKSYFETFLKELPQSFDLQGTTFYKARNELKRIVWNNRTLIVKSFQEPDCLRRYIYGTFRKSKAKRSYENALTLLARGIETPEPLGFIECYRFGALGKSFYVCTHWQSDLTLRECLTDRHYPNRDKILEQFGEFMFRLHSQNIFHKDLSPGNILLTHHSNGEISGRGDLTSQNLTNEDHPRIGFGLVDLNRISFKRLTFQAKMRNFATLWLNDGDLKLIVNVYAKYSGDSPETAFKLASFYSCRHKQRSGRKESMKSFLKSIFGV